MDTLTNYITERIIIAERIRIDNIKRPEFPIDGTVEDIIDFLKEYGFKEIKKIQVPSTYINDYVVPFNDYRNKCFYVDIVATNNTYIYFADTSKHRISESNAFYAINKDNRSDNFFKIWDDDPDAFELLGKYGFKKEMETYFG